MSLFVRLLDEIDDVTHPVSAVLLKARRLASEGLSGTAKATGNTEILQLITRLRGHLGG